MKISCVLGINNEPSLLSLIDMASRKLSCVTFDGISDALSCIPQHEQHRALQDESIPITGLAKAVQESFQPVPGQEQLEILAPFTGQHQQSVAHRGRCIFPAFIIHVTIDSR